MEIWTYRRDDHVITLWVVAGKNVKAAEEHRAPEPGGGAATALTGSAVHACLIALASAVAASLSVLFAPIASKPLLRTHASRRTSSHRDVCHRLELTQPGQIRTRRRWGAHAI